MNFMLSRRTLAVAMALGATACASVGFEEVFEIAEPTADLQPYSHNRFTRA